MNRRLAAGILVAGAAAAVPFSLRAAAPAPTPLTPQQLGFFAGDRGAVLSQCKRLGLVPVARPALPGVEEAASARIEAAVSAALQAAGFEVVPSDSYSKAYERFSRAVGGLYDPMLGTSRKEQALSVYANAAREYFATDQLGCLAMVRVLDTRAKINNRWAVWDGVAESVDGEATGAMSRFFFGGNTGGGELPAVSVVLNFLNRELKSIYGRAGGVQLGAYIDRQHGAQGSDFLYVPRNQLLLDDKRIARAISVVTVPLRYTPEEIAAGAANPATNPGAAPLSEFGKPPAGSVRHEDSPLKQPREQLLASIHRVALGSVQSGGLAVPAETAARYRALVHERLAKLGCEVIDSDALNGALGAAALKVGGFYDPMSGKLDAERLRTAMHAAFGSIGISPAPDAVLVVVIGKMLATQKAGNAAWDGAEQSALTLAPAVKGTKLFGGTEDRTAGESTISASVLHLLLRDPDGTVLYDGRGGIELLQQLSIKAQGGYPRIDYLQQFAERTPSELFKDPARDERAVDYALQPLLLSAEAIAAAEAAKAGRGGAPAAKH